MRSAACTYVHAIYPTDVGLSLSIIIVHPHAPGKSAYTSYTARARSINDSRGTKKKYMSACAALCTSRACTMYDVYEGVEERRSTMCIRYLRV